MDPTNIAIEEALKNRKLILSALKEAWKRVTEGKLTVALFGVGGTGKTTTTKLLTEGISASSANTTYLPTVGAKKAPVKDRFLTSVWDTAGQEDVRAATWTQAISSIQNSNKAVIINVTSFGFNSAGDVPFSDLKKALGKNKKDEAIAAYLAAERKKELNLLTELQPELKHITGKMSFLTVINKQDLWWNQRQKVMKHYTAGAYMTRLQNIRRQHGEKNFTYAFRQVALCPVNLVTVDGTTLAETCSRS